MKVKLSTLEGSDTALLALATHKLPGKITYQMTRIVRVMKDALADYRAGVQATIEEFGEPVNAEKTGLNQPYLIPAANRVAYDAAMKDRGDVEIELYGEPFPLSSLKDKRTNELPDDYEPGVFVPLLDWLIVDDTPQPEEKVAAA